MTKGAAPQTALLKPTLETPTARARQLSRFLLMTGLMSMLVMWAFNYLAVKIALRHFDALTLIAFRFEVAGMAMLAIYLGQKSRTRLQRRHIWTITYLGFFGVIVNQGLFTLGLNYTTSSHSAIISAIDPVLILALACAIGIESMAAGKAIGVGLAFAGVLVLETEHGSPANSPLLVGDLISVGAAIGFSVYAVLAKRITEVYDSIALNTFNILVAAIVFLPVAFREGIRLDWRGVGWEGWTAMCYMAVFSSVLAYLIFFWALRHMDPSRVAVINYLQPILVILLATALLSEQMTRHLLLSTALVLLGVYLAERGARIV
jgi:drug/metabolite transporter (DMT)-like permease